MRVRPQRARHGHRAPRPAARHPRRRLQGAERRAPDPAHAGFGLILGHPELTVDRLYEQPGIVSAPQAAGLRVGERVRIVPNHACTTANLHRRALIVHDDDVADVWSIGAAGPGG